MSIVLLATSACTVVQIEGGDVRRYAGSLRVEPVEGADLVTIASRNYGVVADGRNFTIGYGQSRTIVVPDSSRCTIVMILEDGADQDLPAHWREFLNDYPNVCVEGGKHD